MSSSFKCRYFILSGSVHPIFSLHRIFIVELLAYVKDSLQCLDFHRKEKVFKRKYFSVLSEHKQSQYCFFLVFSQCPAFIIR